MKGLYVHIPFCEHICFYCDFAKRVPKDLAMIDLYLDKLIEELSSYAPHFSTIETIYIGGGTPSILNLKQTEKLLDALKNIHPIEYTIEVNPESYTKEKGLLYKAYGINRISLGVQTFNLEILKALNRKHSLGEVDFAIKSLREIGIENINLDLIYALPNQRLEDLQHDLQEIRRLNPMHISAYSLILEEKTVFYHEYLKGNFKPQTEDMEAQMYQLIIDTLVAFGYEHYEISNFAKRNFQSQHNTIYWSLGEYIGVGMGAHGFVDGYRTQNYRQLNTYMASIQENKIWQTEAMRLQDELIFGLRKRSGIDLHKLEETYQINLFETFPALHKHLENKLIEIIEGRLRLTHQGLFLGNQVFMVFV